MDDIVVQRRTGRPNRGGGRRGRRGGRRGRGGGRGSGEGGEGGHGRGGRRSTEPSGSGQAKPFHAFHTQGPGQYGAHQTGYADDQASFVPKVKVPMQKLQMTSENQEMVRDMLRDLRGGEQTIADEDGYNELDVRTEDHYWMEDNQLVIEEIAPFAIESFSANIVPREECGEVNPYSVQKLIRYGFNKEQCIEALFLYEGDIGTALEYLISESVGLPMNQDHKENNSQDELDIIQDISHEDDNHANVPWEDILEQRNDEMIALQSIYEDKFIERISNRMFIIKRDRSKNLEKPCLWEIGQEEVKMTGVVKQILQKKLRQNKTLKEEYKNKQNSSKYKSMQVNRQNLPAWDKQKDILKLIHDNQVVVISGMTGCGKTTQIPQFILDSSLKTSGLDVCNILCTQPRRISAIAVAERVAEERAEKLGRIIGYKIRLEKVQSTFTRLLYCTNGIILRQLEGDPELQGVTHLILDEVHERSEESDFLLMYLRDLLPKRPDLKIILMSATLNVDLFSEYFYYCPVLDIPGRAFPVDQFFLEDIIEFTKFVIEENSPFARPLKDMNALRQAKYSEGTSSSSTETCHVATKDENLSPKQLYERYSDYSKTTSRVLSVMDLDKINFDLIVELLMWIAEGNHEYPKEGAILIFMPGFAEIQTLFEMLQTHEMFGRKNRGSYRIIPLHSTLSSEDQHAVFARPPKDVRKIVISTNIAETSITIDDVVFVIDSGKMKEKSYDACKGMESLNVVWVSKANALQRKGRAGRVTSGICFHLFTSHRYNYHLQPQPVPGIRRVPLEQIVLRIKMLDILKSNDAEQVLNNLPEPPDPDSISSASKRLQDLELTPLGFHLGTLPVDVRIGKLMLFGAIFRCLDSALTIAASLSFKSPFVSPFGKKNEADKKRLEFAAGNSDHLTVVNAYKGWIEAKKKGPYEASKFCHESFLSQKSFQMLASMKQQFVVLLSDIDFIHKKISARDLERAARSGGDGVVMETGPEANINSDNWRIVSAILVGALYPNIVQIMTPATKFSQSSSGAVHKAPKPEELKFKTKVDGYVSKLFYIHPSSVNFQVRYYESPYLVYHEKVKTSKVYLRDCTMVSVYPLLLFGGGAVSVDLDRGNFILSVDDGWIRFVAASHQIAELVRELRLELDQLLSDKIENPNMDLCTCPRGSRIIETIVKLISSQ
ncbi:hypothetical protein ScPMuIL_014675 [Solemya velum]